MDSGMECTLSRFVSKLSDASDLLEGRDATQRDLDGLERWAYANLVEFSKAKCKVLHQDWDNPKQRHKSGREWPGKQP